MCRSVKFVKNSKFDWKEKKKLEYKNIGFNNT